MIEITARIIREKGFKSATVRAIADEAGVNIASVRYYFGSKEELMGRAIEYLMGHFEQVAAALDDGRYTPKERLRNYIRAYFQLARQHPALFRSISRPSSEDSQDTYFVYLGLLHDQCWEKVIRNVAAMTGLTDRTDLELKSMQIFSAIEFPIIIDSNQPDSFVKNYFSPECIERYIDLLLDDVSPQGVQK